MNASKTTAVIGSIAAALIFVIYLFLMQYEMIDYLALGSSLISIVISVAGIEELFHKEKNSLFTITGTMLIYFIYPIVIIIGGLLSVTLFRFAGTLYLLFVLFFSGCLAVYMILMKNLSIYHHKNKKPILDAIDQMQNAETMLNQLKIADECKPYQKQLQNCLEMLQACDPTRCSDIYELILKELRLLKPILSYEETEKEEIEQSLISIEQHIKEAYTISSKGKSGTI